MQKKKQIILAMNFSPGAKKLHFETSGGLALSSPPDTGLQYDEKTRDTGATVGRGQKFGDGHLH